MTAGVIILNYNGKEYIEEILDAVFSQTIIDNLQVIVVDQASSDGSYELIKEGFGKRIDLIRLDKNVGFTCGNNMAIRRAQGEYILRLDSDAVPQPRWAEALIDAAKSDPSIGMCTSKILFYKDRGLIDCAGHDIFPDGLNRSRGNMERDRGQFDSVEETLFASGCASLYRRDTVVELGGYDQDFFIYGDDADLGLKIRFQGLKCLYVPDAVVYHHGSRGLGAHSLRKLYFIERNRIWVLWKYFPVSWILAAPYFTLRRLFRAWRASKKGGGIAGEYGSRYSALRIGATILCAWGAALLGLPKTLGKRRKIMAGRKITRKEIKALLRRFRPSLQAMSFGLPDNECR